MAHIRMTPHYSTLLHITPHIQKAGASSPQRVDMQRLVLLYGFRVSSVLSSVLRLLPAPKLLLPLGESVSARGGAVGEGSGGGGGDGGGGKEGGALRRWIVVSAAFLSARKISLLQRWLQLLVDELYLLLSLGEVLAPPVSLPASLRSANTAVSPSTPPPSCTTAPGTKHIIFSGGCAEGLGEGGGVEGEGGGGGGGRLGVRRNLLYMVPEVYVAGLVSTMTLLHQLQLPLFDGHSKVCICT